jgi:hypothetical protein
MAALSISGGESTNQERVQGGGGNWRGPFRPIITPTLSLYPILGPERRGRRAVSCYLGPDGVERLAPALDEEVGVTRLLDSGEGNEDDLGARNLRMDILTCAQRGRGRLPIGAGSLCHRGPDGGSSSACVAMRGRGYLGSERAGREGREQRAGREGR